MGNRRGQSFVVHTLSALRKSAKVRSQYEQDGVHIPPFLIASIASSCNLRCSGCYARANGGCGNETVPQEMNADDWQRIFSEASGIGVSFILLAGGEPLLRRDIIRTAAQFQDIVFPVFTNGTMIDEEYMEFFDQHRNLIPVLSIEGDDIKTDARRGKGVSETVWHAARRLKEKGILFGASITVTKENKEDVTQNTFVRELQERGCGLVFFVEYVPVEAGTEHLVLDSQELLELQERIELLRTDKLNKGMIMLSFPGDEEAMGGCLAAGRGFFHINPNGGAEPCPFSPYSEMNLKEQTLLTVLQSAYFKRIREISAAESSEHSGGCTLFRYEKQVQHALNQSSVVS